MVCCNLDDSRNITFQKNKEHISRKKNFVLITPTKDTINITRYKNFDPKTNFEQGTSIPDLKDFTKIKFIKFNLKNNFKEEDLFGNQKYFLKDQNEVYRELVKKTITRK